MAKILIITDSNGDVLYNTAEIYFDGTEHEIWTTRKINRQKREKEHITSLYSFQTNNTFFDILSLNARSAWNFAKYTDLINVNFDNYDHIYMYMGFNDYVPIQIHNNPAEAASKYVNDIQNKFDNKVTIILPLQNESLFKSQPGYWEIYEIYLSNIKNNAYNKGIDVVDINDIVGHVVHPISYRDENHLKETKYLPLLKYMLKD